METVEMLLTVQRQWMYLENIFLGEDIRKQLPRESAEFDGINKTWKEIMTRLNGDKNALRGTHFPGMVKWEHDQFCFYCIDSDIDKVANDNQFQNMN